MTAASDQANARARLTYIVHVLRPDWDMQGIEAAIEAAHEAKHTLGEICRSAIDAAMTVSTKTPAGIGARLRDGWTSNQVQEKPIQHFSGPEAKPCPIRGHGFHTGDKCDGRPFVPATSKLIQAARNAAREAAQAQQAVEADRERARAEREAEKREEVAA